MEDPTRYPGPGTFTPSDTPEEELREAARRCFAILLRDEQAKKDSPAMKAMQRDTAARAKRAAEGTR